MSEGTNVEIQVGEDGIATIMVDLNQRNGQSKSGKTVIVGSTHGAVKVRDSEGRAVSVSLNVYAKS